MLLMRISCQFSFTWKSVTFSKHKILIDVHTSWWSDYLRRPTHQMKACSLFCASQWNNCFLLNKKWGSLEEFKCIQLMNMFWYYLSSTCDLHCRVITGDKNMSHFIVMVDLNDLHLGLIKYLCRSQRLWAVRSISTSLKKGHCWNLNRYIVSRWEIVSSHRRHYQWSKRQWSCHCDILTDS